MNKTKFMQTDSRWGSLGYPKKPYYLRNCGCGEVSIANILIEMDKRSEYDLGYILYFFELACAISGYMLGVNPFDQPGVEAYKKNMFALLGKPGYEELASELEKKLK
jgi:glucose-6-phosphate isomerase